VVAICISGVESSGPATIIVLVTLQRRTVHKQSEVRPSAHEMFFATAVKENGNRCLFM